MKKLLLLILPVVLGLLGCSKDSVDEPEQVLDNVSLEWLQKNIVGNWYATHIYNSLSGVWVGTSLGYKDNSFVFSADGEVIISGLHTLNGKHPYSLSTTNGKTFLTIGSHKEWVMSIDIETGQITLGQLAKLQKL